MERDAALRLLKSTKPDERLRAARALAHAAREGDLEAIKLALAGETNRWVKSALTKVTQVLQVQGEPVKAEINVEGEDERIIEEIHAEAVEETTQRLIHEIRPVLGRLELHAAREIPDYENSRTKKEWQHLDALLTAIDKLGQAASAPSYAEFDLAELIESIAASENAANTVKVELAGPKPMVLISSKGLLQIVLCNALRNAIEATEGMPAPGPVVVNWGVTDRDYWIAVLDSGCGIPAGFGRAFEVGTTTKKAHLGMGLALARQAALSLNARISLSPRKEGGARLDFSCPLPS